jgi:hypothetical protein
MLYLDRDHPYFNEINMYDSYNINKFLKDFYNLKNEIIFPKSPNRSEEIKDLVRKMLHKN